VGSKNIVLRMRMFGTLMTPTNVTSADTMICMMIRDNGQHGECFPVRTPFDMPKEVDGVPAALAASAIPDALLNVDGESICAAALGTRPD
jgi:hypothetical protein